MAVFSSVPVFCLSLLFAVSFTTSFHSSSSLAMAASTAGHSFVTTTRTPSTTSPTISPFTSSPTISPFTSSPSIFPSQTPSISPTLSPLTTAPTTSSPTFPPTSALPTRAPTTSFPSESPTTSFPTETPTNFPSHSPTTSSPTTSPTTSAPTTSPTFFPTQQPSTSTPTESPTESPTWSPTLSPTLPPTTATVTFNISECGCTAGSVASSQIEQPTIAIVVNVNDCTDVRGINFPISPSPASIIVTRAETGGSVSPAITLTVYSDSQCTNAMGSPFYYDESDICRTTNLWGSAPIEIPADGIKLPPTYNPTSYPVGPPFTPYVPDPTFADTESSTITTTTTSTMTTSTLTSTTTSITSTTLTTTPFKSITTSVSVELAEPYAYSPSTRSCLDASAPSKSTADCTDTNICLTSCPNEVPVITKMQSEMLSNCSVGSNGVVSANLQCGTVGDLDGEALIYHNYYANTACSGTRILQSLDSTYTTLIEGVNITSSWEEPPCVRSGAFTSDSGRGYVQYSVRQFEAGCRLFGDWSAEAHVGLEGSYYEDVNCATPAERTCPITLAPTSSPIEYGDGDDNGGVGVGAAVGGSVGGACCICCIIVVVLCCGGEEDEKQFKVKENWWGGVTVTEIR